MPWPPVQCDGCAWWPSQRFEILGGILVRYSHRSHLTYEATRGFFALRTLRSQPKLTQLLLTP